MFYADGLHTRLEQMKTSKDLKYEIWQIHKHLFAFGDSLREVSNKKLIVGLLVEFYHHHQRFSNKDVQLGTNTCT